MAKRLEPIRTKERSPITTRQRLGEVLHCAANFPATVRFLVAAAAKAGISDYVNRTRSYPDGPDDATPLCWAAATPYDRSSDGGSGPENALALVRTLLSLGANPNGNPADSENPNHYDHPLLCAQRGKDRHGAAGYHDAIIEVLLVPSGRRDSGPDRDAGRDRSARRGAPLSWIAVVGRR